MSSLGAGVDVVDRARARLPHAGLTEQQIADLEALAEPLSELESLYEDHPLAVVRLWHREGMLDVAKEAGPEFVDHIGERIARTSQCTAVGLLALNKTVIIGGGNRSGKTYGTKCAIVALGLGSDHPMARAFWEGNGIDPDAFPTGPANASHNDGEVWIIAVDSSASKEYHRESIEVLLTPGTYKWHKRDSDGPALLEVMCPGYDYPARFRFKTDGPKARKRMQGQKCRAIWHDEEGPTDDAWDECCSRLTDTNGWHIMSNTPVDGLTWVEGRLVAKDDPETAEIDAVVYHLHTIDNPNLSPEGIKNLRRGDKRIRLAKMFGRAVSRSGLVYPMLDRNVHVVEPFEIPWDWPRYKAIDFGTRAPFAVVWAAMSPEDVLYVYREHFEAERTLRHHVLTMLEAEGWVVDWNEGTWEAPPALPPEEGEKEGRIPVERFVRILADPEDPQQMMQLIRTYNMAVRKADKHRKLGIDAVCERLDPEQEGGPGLKFFSTCINTIREHRGYIWKPKTLRTEPDEPLKKDDHTCDDVRYLCRHLARGTAGFASG